MSKKPHISNDLYEFIMNGITSGVWVADRHDVIHYANRAMEMIAGVTHQRLIGSAVFSELAENAAQYFKLHYLEAKETLKPVHYADVPVMTPAGRQTFQSGWLIPKVKDGQYDGMICTVEDITNQKQARNALKASEAKYRELVESANSIIMRMDMKGTIIFFNAFAQKFFGFAEQEIVGRNVLGTIIPKTAERKRKLTKMFREIGKNPERYENIEDENIRENGERVWISWTNRALFRDGISVVEILCIGNDITAQKYHENLLEQCRMDLEDKVRIRTMQLTQANENLHQEIDERKWAEQVLRISEEKYRLVVEHANEGIVVTQDDFFKYANPKAERILGYSSDDLRSKPFTEFIHPDDRDLMRERHLRRLRGDNLPHFFSSRIIDPEGTVRWLEINSVLITWMGRPATLAFFNNITERKRAEEMLHLLRTAIQQARDSIVITTANPARPMAKIVFVNAAFTKMTGYTAEEVIGKPSLILQGPEAEGMVWTKFEAGSADSKAFYLETVAYRKDGTHFDVEWQITPLRDDKRKVSHFVSIQRDITERKRAEEKFTLYQEQLRSLTSELSLAEESERRRIATQIHDHIGQTLAITKIRLGALKDSCDSGHIGQIDEIRGLIEQTIASTKSLTFELSPPILYELGLEATIEWLSEQMQKQHYILFSCENDGDLKPLTREMSILLFQVVRELYMNIVKHAQAHQVLTYIRKVDENVMIVVEDDGIGFDFSSIDRRLTFGFFSIRERLKYLGGTLEVDSTPGKGTRITVISPLARSGDETQRYP
ncbi:MAG: PAS domain S-box protein [Nitrospirae bacterium]|nr:PAS domain S-box protein [Nitrospirota bacterium]